MPITYEIDADLGLIAVTLTGRLTRKDFDDYFRATARDPAFRQDLLRLAIITGVKSFPPSAEVAEISQVIRQRSMGAARFAVVVDAPLGIGMTNMFLGMAGLS